MKPIPTTTRPIHLPEPIDPNYRAALIYTDDNPYPIYLPRVAVDIERDDSDKAKEPTHWPPTKTAAATQT